MATDTDLVAQMKRAAFCAKTTTKQLVEQILEEGGNLNCFIRDEFTPLYIASSKGDKPLVSLLLDRGAEVNLACKNGDTPLHIASKKGYYSVVNILIDRGGDVNVSIRLGWTPLYTACFYKRFSIAKVLLERGARADPEIISGHVDELDADHQIQCRPTHTPLFLAAMDGHLDLVKLMLEKGAEVDRRIKPVNGEAPLHIACMKGHYDVVKLLLDNGACVNLCVETVIPDGLDLSNKTQVFSITPLMMAIFRRHSRVVRLLLERGAQMTQATFSLEEFPQLAIYITNNVFGFFSRFLVCGYTFDLQDLMMISYKDGYYDLFIFVLDKITKCGKQIFKVYEVLEYAYKENMFDMADACIERCVKPNRVLNRVSIKTLHDHLQKLKVVGLFEFVLSADQTTLDRCNTEIQNIKAFKVLNGVSLYIVFERYKDPYYLRNQDLLEILDKYLNSEEAEEQFPLYGKILRNRLLGSKYRLSLLTKTLEALEGQRWNMLPLPIQEHILLHLDNSDLENMHSSE